MQIVRTSRHRHVDRRLAMGDATLSLNMADGTIRIHVGWREHRECPYHYSLVAAAEEWADLCARAARLRDLVGPFSPE
jgi:hypothetical protein